MTGAKFDPDDMPPLEVTTMALERARIYARARLSAYLLATMELRSWPDQVTDSLVLELTAQVLRRSLAEGTETVPWQGRVTVEVEDEGTPALSGWALGVIIGLLVMVAGLPFLTGRIILVGYGLGLTIAALMLRRFNPRRPPRTHTVETTVVGQVEVHGHSWHTFPNADVAYPPELRDPIYVVTHDSSASLRQRPEGGW